MSHVRETKMLKPLHLSVTKKQLLSLCAFLLLLWMTTAYAQEQVPIDDGTTTQTSWSLSGIQIEVQDGGTR